MEPVRVLRLPEVLTLTGLKRSAVYESMARGDFPRPIKLTTRAVGWRVEAVAAWIANRAA